MGQRDFPPVFRGVFQRGMCLLFQQRHLQADVGQRGAQGQAGGAGADDQHVGIECKGFGHGRHAAAVGLPRG